MRLGPTHHNGRPHRWPIARGIGVARHEPACCCSPPWFPRLSALSSQHGMGWRPRAEAGRGSISQSVSRLQASATTTCTHGWGGPVGKGVASGRRWSNLNHTTLFGRWIAVGLSLLLAHAGRALAGPALPVGKTVSRLELGAGEPGPPWAQLVSQRGGPKGLPPLLPLVPPSPISPSHTEGAVRPK